MVAAIIGAIYYGQTLDHSGVININGVIFIFLTSMTFQNVFAVINVRTFFCTCTTCHDIHWLNESRYF